VTPVHKRPKTVAVAPASTSRPSGPEIVVGGIGSISSDAPLTAGDSGSGTDSPPSFLPLFLMATLGIALAAVGVALTPPWILPRQMGFMVFERRDPMLIVGMAIALGIGVGLVITLA
jgi:hypothetical protein